MRALIALFICFPVWAQDFSSRMKDAYASTDSNFDLECRYAYTSTFKLISPVSPTVKGADFIQRDFTLETPTDKATMSFVVKANNGSIDYQLLFEGRHNSRGKVSKREFLIAPVDNLEFAQRFETSKITCNVNFAYAYPYALRDGAYHINVHPHVIYDWQNLLKDKVEKYLADGAHTSLVLLENGNYRGNLVNILTFLRGEPYTLPQKDYQSNLEQVGAEIPLIVSPAGHNRYAFHAKDLVKVTFTGGNHNYCIWNNTREILEAFMRSRSTARVLVYYDTDSIVAQARGIEGMALNFPKRDINRSNLLKHLLQNGPVAAKYHRNYHSYFRNTFFKEFRGMFKTLRLTYSSVNLHQTDVLEGSGERELEIELRYLE